MSQAADISLWIAFSAGLLSFFSPCVLPLIPSYLTYITGLSFAELDQSHPGMRVRWRVIAHSLAFVLGFSIVFISLGALAGFASFSLQQTLRESLIWVQRLGGVLIFLFGIHMTGLFHFGVLLGEKRVHLRDKPSGYLGTMLVGLAFAAGWTPCIGPILGGILTLVAGTAGDTWRGVVLLSTYSVGLGIPFLLAGLLFHGFLEFFKRFRKHIRLGEIFTGILLMVVGVLLFFNQIERIGRLLQGMLPAVG